MRWVDVFGIVLARYEQIPASVEVLGDSQNSCSPVVRVSQRKVHPVDLIDNIPVGWCSGCLAVTDIRHDHKKEWWGIF